MLRSWLSLNRCSEAVKIRRQSRFQRISTSASDRILCDDDLGPTHADAYRTFRCRKDESAESLPLPPLLDPVIQQNRFFWQQPKAKPNPARLTTFQKSLLANPYAIALASSVRACRTTKVLLPAVFLTTLHVRPHPKTKDPWLLPVSLTTNDERRGIPHRLISRHSFVEWITANKKMWQRTLDPRLRDTLTEDDRKNLVWRQDMPDFLLAMMRKRLWEKMKWFFNAKKSFKVVASPRPEDLQHLDSCSCILIFASLGTRADVILRQVDSIREHSEMCRSRLVNHFSSQSNSPASLAVTHHTPAWCREPQFLQLLPRIIYPELEFPGTIWRGKRVPVYSLTDLLGEEYSQTLFQSSRYRKARCLVFETERRSLTVQVLLMQLQAYMARPGI